MNVLGNYNEHDLRALRLSVSQTISLLQGMGLPATDQRILALNRLGAKLVETSIELGLTPALEPVWQLVAPVEVGK